jgi:hypothetical protein
VSRNAPQLYLLRRIAATAGSDFSAWRDFAEMENSAEKSVNAGRYFSATVKGDLQRLAAILSRGMLCESSGGSAVLF